MHLGYSLKANANKNQVKLNKKDFNLSSKQILLDIGSMIYRAQKLLTEEHEYNALLKAILKIKYYFDEYEHLPTLKELSADTGIKYNKVRKQIREIYDDLLFGYDKESSQGSPFIFKEITYSFSVKGFSRSHIYFEVTQLPVVPRVGEEIQLPFFQAYLNTSRFHVESICHWFNNQKQ